MDWLETRRQIRVWHTVDRGPYRGQVMEVGVNTFLWELREREAANPLSQGSATTLNEAKGRIEVVRKHYAGLEE